MVLGVGTPSSWQHVATSNVVTRSRCVYENSWLRDGQRRATPIEWLVPARRRQHAVLWSGAARVTMQAAPSTDMQSEQSQPNAAAAVESGSNGAATADEGIAAVLAPGSVADVEELCGVRVNVDDLGQPLVEYLVHWKVRTYHVTMHSRTANSAIFKPIKE